MLEGLFHPRGVVVVGVSENPNKLGYRVAENMITSGYPGSLYFVNPRGGKSLIIIFLRTLMIFQIPLTWR